MVEQNNQNIETFTELRDSYVDQSHFALTALPPSRNLTPEKKS